MLFTYKFVENHKAYKLQEYIAAFFNTIKNLNSSIPFSLNLFDSAFHQFLIKGSSKNSTTKLYNLLNSFYDVYIVLSDDEQKKIIDIFSNNNDVENLCSNSEPCIKIDSLHTTIQLKIKDLFEHLYKDTLSELRHKHYMEFTNINENICGFCGIDTNVAPKIENKEYTQDYDHLLDIATFPFAGINFKNIVPCCEKCNRKFKLQQKILLDNDGTRRKAFYPYLKQVDLHRIEIQNLVLPKSVLDTNIDCNLSFASYNHEQTEEINTWLTVYKIKGRYNEELNKSYSFYEKILLQYLRNLHKRKKIEDISELKNSIKSYQKILYSQKYQDKNFLKIAYIDLLLKQSDSYFNSVMKYL
jgi:hypothetical protein